MNNFFHANKGFTLIEVLVSISIAFVLMGALASVLMGSGHMTKVLDSRSRMVIENTMITLETIARDIQNSPVYPDIPFWGNENEVSFPRMFEGTQGLDSLSDFELGQIQTRTLGQIRDFLPVRYYFDDFKKTLVKEFPPGESTTILSGIEGVEFTYAIFQGEDGWVWEPETPEEGSVFNIGAMRIQVQLDSSSNPYQLPKVERNFLILRRHPLSGQLADPGYV